MCVLIHQNSMDSTLANKVMKKTPLDLQNGSRYAMCVGPFLRLSIPPGTGWCGKDTGWLATWDSPLRTDSESSKNSRIIHTTDFILYFLNLACEFKDSVSIFDELIFYVDPWNRFNSSISSRLFHGASHSTTFAFPSAWRFFPLCSRFLAIDDLAWM